MIQTRLFRYIRSKLVNDGVCDCCDGSDEWKGLELSEENKLPRQGENVRFTPCSDVCYDYELQESARLDVIAQGKELKVRFAAFSIIIRPRLGRICKSC